MVNLVLWTQILIIFMISEVKMQKPFSIQNVERIEPCPRRGRLEKV